MRLLVSHMSEIMLVCEKLTIAVDQKQEQLPFTNITLDKATVSQ